MQDPPFVDPPFIPCPELPSSLQEIASKQRRHFNGNRLLQGCPLFAGWRFKIERYTTPQERKALRDLGWKFSGGWWYQQDAEPYGYGK